MWMTLGDSIPIVETSGKALMSSDTGADIVATSAESHSRGVWGLQERGKEVGERVCGEEGAGKRRRKHGVDKGG